MLDKKFKLSPEIIFRIKTDAEGTSGKAFDQDNDILHELSPEASEILSLIDGSRTVNDVIKVLCAKFDCDGDEISEDTVSFITQALKQNLIVESD